MATCVARVVGVSLVPRASTRRCRRRASSVNSVSVDYCNFKDDDRRSYGEWGDDGLRQNSSSMANMTAEWEDEARRVWMSRGASETRVVRLLILGSKHRKDGVGEIFRDVVAIERMCATLERLVDGVRSPEIFHRVPEAALVCVDESALTRAIVRLRSAVPIQDLNLSRVIEKAPKLLMLDDADDISRVTDSCHALSDALGVTLHDKRLQKIVEETPDCLFQESEVIKSAVEEMRPLNEHYPSLADFIADHSEALVVPHMRQTLAHTHAMRHQNL